ncbi:hypothetical protein ACLOJK_038703, partial [Asimina triloba]
HPMELPWQPITVCPSADPSATVRPASSSTVSRRKQPPGPASSSIQDPVDFNNADHLRAVQAMTAVGFHESGTGRTTASTDRSQEPISLAASDLQQPDPQNPFEIGDQHLCPIIMHKSLGPPIQSSLGARFGQPFFQAAAHHDRATSMAKRHHAQITTNSGQSKTHLEGQHAPWPATHLYLRLRCSGRLADSNQRMQFGQTQITARHGRTKMQQIDSN